MGNLVGIAVFRLRNVVISGFEGYARMVMPCEWKTESRKRKRETYMEICGKCDDAMVAKGLLKEYP